MLKQDGPLRVLVFPCGSEVGLEVHRALSWCSHLELIGASSTPSNHGRMVFAEHHDTLPWASDPLFPDALAELCRQRRVDLFFPVHDEVLVRVDRVRAALSVDVLASSAETCKVVCSKRETYRRLGAALRVPRLYSPHERSVPLPAFVKPDFGYGSRNSALARTRTELELLTATTSGAIVLEYLPGAEYTVDCFTDRHRQLRFVGPRQRLRTSSGAVTHAVPVPTERFQPLAEAVNSHLELRGAWFFQVREASDGELALLEVGARVAGGMGLYRNLGVNLPLLAVYDRLGVEVEVDVNSFPLEMDRALTARFRLGVDYQHAYLDFDDTLVVRGRVNPLLVAFMVQCRNRGVGLHLLSRHPLGLAEKLRQLGLEAFFDTVHQVGQSSPKAELIRETPAILVDDSFEERRAVRAALGIPTFAVDAVESLVDWTQP